MTHKAHKKRNGINPTQMFKPLFEELEGVDADQILAMKPVDREFIGSYIVQFAPHTLYDDNWALLLVFALVS